MCEKLCRGAAVGGLARALASLLSDKQTIEWQICTAMFLSQPTADARASAVFLDQFIPSRATRVLALEQKVFMNPFSEEAERAPGVREAWRCKQVPAVLRRVWRLKLSADKCKPAPRFATCANDCEHVWKGGA